MSFYGVKPPKDADGKEIPLDVRFLYNKNGEMFEVAGFSYHRGDNKWTVILYGGLPNYTTSSMLLSHPDSWNKLEHDATLAPRNYLQARGLEKHKDGRIATMMLDLVSRAKTLAEREKRND